MTYRGGDDATDFYGTSDAAHNVTHDCKGVTGWSYQFHGSGALSWKCTPQQPQTQQQPPATGFCAPGRVWASGFHPVVVWGVPPGIHGGTSPFGVPIVAGGTPRRSD